MHDDAPTHPVATYLGIDVSKDHLDVCRHTAGYRQMRRFANTPDGHRTLIAWLENASTRACMEASGRYGLDLALALCETDSLELMGANPRAIKHFREASMYRTKTDRVDAAVIFDYARRMPFEAGEPPEEATRELRVITRRIQALSQKLLRHRAHAGEKPPACGQAEPIELAGRHQ